jgi:hypothetical protein
MALSVRLTVAACVVPEEGGLVGEQGPLQAGAAVVVLWGTRPQRPGVQV